MNLRELLQAPGFFTENRLAARSDHRACFPGEVEPRRLALDGEWRFFYASDLNGRIDGFETDEAVSAGWARIEVPGHIDLAGYGAPQYTNTAYPWDGREQLFPPQLPEKIPVGQYARNFVLPEGWKGNFRLRFEGVEPAFRVWCNGRYVGYSEDSFTPAEFDVTEIVHTGVNFLAVEVYRWASGSWLEDQDFWRFWGIFRSVNLLCLPVCHLEDIHIRADMNGVLCASAAASGGADELCAALYAADGALLLHQRVPVREGAAEFQMELAQPLLWSAERPYLYTLSLELVKEGRVEEVCRQEVGFRTFCIEDGVMKLNGKRIVFHGANRHEWSAQSGRVITVEEMEQDARLMKRNNINAVRTSHYPNRSEWYAICDRIGLYMIDEVDLETHGTWCRLEQKAECRLPLLPDDLPEWRAAVFDRARSMFARDKNHPAILIWSCGNESRGGKTIYEVSNLLRQWDGTRPIHYESITYDPRYPDTTDIRSTMYYPAEHVERILKEHPEKPYIQVEYAHAMGNSCGALDYYARLERIYPHYQGGFVWDWVDQQLLVDGKLQYGGDFGDAPNDGDFCADGLLFADHTPSPKLAEVKAVFTPFPLTVEKRCVRLRNESLFTGTENMTLEVSFLCDGQEFGRCELHADVPPGEERAVPFQLPEMPAEGEIAAQAQLLLGEDAPWAEKGYSVSCAHKVLRTRAEAASGWTLVDGAEYLGLSTERLQALFIKKSGLLLSLRVDGCEWVKKPFLPVFWRAPVSNDTASRWPQEKAMWKAASLYPALKRFRVEENGPCYEVAAEWELPTAPKSRCRMRYRFERDGKLHITLDAEKAEGLPAPFCFGLEGAAGEEARIVQYYGLGPEEAASDRTAGVRLGVWQLDAWEALTPYMKPQDCAVRAGVRWLNCGGLRIEGDAPFLFSALPYTCHELEAAGHTWQLPPKDKTVLRLLAWECGVAGDDTWGARPHQEYRMEDEPLHMAFTVSAV